MPLKNISCHPLWEAGLSHPTAKHVLLAFRVPPETAECRLTNLPERPGTRTFCLRVLFGSSEDLAGFHTPLYQQSPVMLF